MPNSIDFRADQIQTKQIIVTGSGAGTTKLLIYGIEAQGSPVNEGLINQTVFPSDTTIGSDVFLYVSGALNTKGSATKRGTSVFGGDLVVSGSLYNGLVTAAGGIYSHAEGYLTTAQAGYSHAEGYNTIANGGYSHAEGSLTTTQGDASHAEGETTIAEGDYSHAEGQLTLANGIYAHAEGYLTTGSGEASHAEGQLTTAQGDYSHAEGMGTVASGKWSHAEGRDSTVNANYSHAEGYLTKTTAHYSHAEGYLTTGSGEASHAEGNTTKAIGFSSHAEGYQTIAFGTGSHASGNGTIASGSVNGAALSAASILQTATGRFNKRENTTSLFVVGNGTGDSDALRGDIFRAESTGELVISGAIRHAIKVVDSSVTATTNMTRSDYLVLVQTISTSATVVLPEITDVVTDLGLTVEIRQMDSALSGRTVTIQPHANNSTYRIRGFDTSAAANLVLGAAPAGTNTNRSVTLTFMGFPAASPLTWVVIATSTC